MTDYRKTPNLHPWSGEVSAGDILSSAQNYTIDHTRLRDFGLETYCPNPREPDTNKRRWVVRAVED